MATNLENLNALKASYIQALQNMIANPRPNYSLDGESYSFSEFQRFLLDALNSVNALIQAENLPFIARSRARV